MRPSTQTTEYQREAAERLHLSVPTSSDHSLRLASAFGLPMFQASGLTLLRRLTMIIQAGVIRHVFYPVHPPEKNADAVISWVGNQCCCRKGSHDWFGWLHVGKSLGSSGRADLEIILRRQCSERPHIANFIREWANSRNFIRTILL
nr:redoxin family protein [Rhizobium sp. AN64]